MSFGTRGLSVCPTVTGQVVVACDLRLMKDFLLVWNLGPLRRLRSRWTDTRYDSLLGISSLGVTDARFAVAAPVF